MVSKHSCLAKKKMVERGLEVVRHRSNPSTRGGKREKFDSIAFSGNAAFNSGRFTFVGWTVSGTAAIFFLYKRPINIQSSVLFLLGRQVECNIFEVHLIVVGLL